jgi:hypothetical protein
MTGKQPTMKFRFSRREKRYPGGNPRAARISAAEAAQFQSGALGRSFAFRPLDAGGLSQRDKRHH